MSECAHICVCSGIPAFLRSGDKLDDWLSRQIPTLPVTTVRWHDDATALLVMQTPSSATAACEKLKTVAPAGMSVRICNDAFRKRHEAASLLGPLPPPSRPDTDSAVASRFIRAALGSTRGRGAPAAAAATQAAYLRPEQTAAPIKTSASDAALSWRRSSGAPIKTSASSERPVEESSLSWRRKLAVVGASAAEGDCGASPESGRWGDTMGSAADDEPAGSSAPKPRGRGGIGSRHVALWPGDGDEDDSAADAAESDAAVIAVAEAARRVSRDRSRSRKRKVEIVAADGGAPPAAGAGPPSRGGGAAARMLAQSGLLRK